MITIPEKIAPLRSAILRDALLCFHDAKTKQSKTNCIAAEDEYLPLTDTSQGIFFGAEKRPHPLFTTSQKNSNIHQTTIHPLKFHCTKMVHFMYI